MFELKITFDTAEELSSFIAARALPSDPAEAKPAPKPKRARTATDAEVAKAIVGAKIEAEPAEPEPEVNEPSPADDPTVAYADVQKAVTGLAAAKGRGAVLAVLEQFGVDHASKIDEAQWGELLAALTDAKDAD